MLVATVKRKVAILFSYFCDIKSGSRHFFSISAVAVVFFCLAIGQAPTKLPFAIVNQESPEANCSYKSGCSFGNLSCRLTSYFEKSDTFDLKFYENSANASNDVKAGKIWGYVTFDKNYTAALVDRMWNYMEASQLTRNQSL